MGPLLRRFAWLALGIFASACTSAVASSTPVALTVPDPPPRIVPVPAPLPEAAQAEQPARPAPAATANPARRPAAASASAASPGPAPPPAPVSAPAADLRATGPGMPTASAEDVRRVIDRTTRTLDALDRRRLNSSAQTQYDTARRFVAQASSAVQADHLMFARYLADKGEALANGLR